MKPMGSWSSEYELMLLRGMGYACLPARMKLNCPLIIEEVFWGDSISWDCLGSFQKGDALFFKAVVSNPVKTVSPSH